MYQVQINHLKGRIKRLEHHSSSKSEKELCSICEKLLSFIEELSTKRS